MEVNTKLPSVLRIAMSLAFIITLPIQKYVYIGLSLHETNIYCMLIFSLFVIIIWMMPRGYKILLKYTIHRLILFPVVTHVYRLKLLKYLTIGATWWNCLHHNCKGRGAIKLLYQNKQGRFIIRTTHFHFSDSRFCEAIQLFLSFH